MIQRITLFFSLLALSYLSFGQNKLIDSLITQLDKVKMEEKASVLNQIAQNYIPDEPEKCLLYANKALDLANQLKNTEQVGGGGWLIKTWAWLIISSISLTNHLLHTGKLRIYFRKPIRMRYWPVST